MRRPDDKRRGRPRRDQDTGAPGRRPPPPSSTGHEARYLQERVAAKTPVTLCMQDGQTVSGVIQSFDRDLITLDTAAGTIIVRKADVRYLGEGAAPAR